MDFKEHLKKMSDLIIEVDEALLQETTQMVCDAVSKHGKVVIAGNGASAAIASHVSVDLTKAAGVRSVNFNEADLITCFSNDYGYEHWIEEALKAYADPADLVILVSSSGRSPSIINAARQAKKMKLTLVTFSGFRRDNELRGMGDINFWVDSGDYNVVETVHQAWLLALVDKLADEFKRTKGAKK